MWEGQHQRRLVQLAVLFFSATPLPLTELVHYSSATYAVKLVCAVVMTFLHPACQFCLSSLREPERLVCNSVSYSAGLSIVLSVVLGTVLAMSGMLTASAVILEMPAFCLIVSGLLSPHAVRESCEANRETAFREGR